MLIFIQTRQCGFCQLSTLNSQLSTKRRKNTVYSTAFDGAVEWNTAIIKCRKSVNVERSVEGRAADRGLTLSQVSQSVRQSVCKSANLQIRNLKSVRVRISVLFLEERLLCRSVHIP